MNPLPNASLKPFLIATLGAALLLPAALTADPAPAPSVTPTPVPGPHTPAFPAPNGQPGLAPHPPFPTANLMDPETMPLPRYLEGIVTLEEFRSFFRFKKSVDDDPANKELIAQIGDLRKQVQRLQNELVKRHAKAMADHPEMQALATKMEQAMFSHGPMPRFPNGPGPGAMPPHPPMMPTVVAPAPKQ